MLKFIKRLAITYSSLERPSTQKLLNFKIGFEIGGEKKFGPKKIGFEIGGKKIRLKDPMMIIMTGISLSAANAATAEKLE
jgi:hypothetical protein